MSSLPVKNLYQLIGEHIETLPNSVVHIENSVYLRSKAITADPESLRNFIDYAIRVIILENIFILHVENKGFLNGLGRGALVFLTFGNLIF